MQYAVGSGQWAVDEEVSLALDIGHGSKDEGGRMKDEQNGQQVPMERLIDTRSYKYGTGSCSDRVRYPFKACSRSETRSLQLPVPYSSTYNTRLFAHVAG